MKGFILLTIAATAVLCVPQPEKLQLWQDYKTQFGKQYGQAGEDHRKMQVFLENLKEIEEHNAKYDAGLVSYTKGINQFSDLTEEEFLEHNRCIISNVTGSSSKLFVPPPNVQVPDSFDWRTQGAVTEVKNQQTCGSCWSFSSTGAIEGQMFRKTGRLVSLSEQNLIDCSLRYGNQGCNGGWPEKSFEYVKDNQGIDTEESYPYENSVGSCRYNPSNSGGTDNGARAVQSGDEEALKIAVATVGPISVLLNGAAIQPYNGGIFDKPDCVPELNHAVLLVGYGTENGKDYWIIKNSWATTWGEGGFGRLSRNKNNQCGIASAAHYPLV